MCGIVSLCFSVCWDFSVVLLLPPSTVGWEEWMRAETCLWCFLLSAFCAVCGDSKSKSKTKARQGKARQQRCTVVYRLQYTDTG